MKILYGIQGTGNGHITRAMDIVPALQKHGEVDLLISGTQCDLQLPYPVKYRLKGMSFLFGKKGGIDFFGSFRKANVWELMRDIWQLPVEEYDLIISDFEPVSAWAAKLAGIRCIGLSNQAAALHPLAPKPTKTDKAGEMLLKYYAPTDVQYGFHFTAFAENIFTPVIRQQVRRQKVADLGHYTVYLPAYDDKRLLKYLKAFPDVHWQVFSKHNKTMLTEGNITIQPVSDKAFTESMATSTGVICAAGFGTTAEALYLQKKLLVIPMKNQFEQECNGAMLKEMGVSLIDSLKERNHQYIESWLLNGSAVKVDYPDITEHMVDKIIYDQFAQVPVISV